MEKEGRVDKNEVGVSRDLMMPFACRAGRSHSTGRLSDVKGRWLAYAGHGGTQSISLSPDTSGGARDSVWLLASGVRAGQASPAAGLTLGLRLGSMMV